MNRTKEVIEFEEKFQGEPFEIIALTGANGFGGGMVPQEKYWTASITLTAWKEKGGEELHEGVYYLTAKADDELLESLRNAADRDQIISVRVRRDDRRFLIEGMPEPAEDAGLEKLLEKQMKSVTFRDESLGTFTLDRTVDWFEAEIKWMGRKIRLNFDNDEEASMRESLNTAHKLVAEQKEWDARVRSFAADELLEIKNDGWLEDDENELVREEFMGRMELESISAGAEGEFEFWFSDDDMFWGHAIYVSGDLEEGPTDADMAG